jgi:putative acetyltransferase
MAAEDVRLHSFVAAHLPELVDLWVASWTEALPQIDFEARRAWFVAHLETLHTQGAATTCAFLTTGAMGGFVTVDAATGYLDQLAVAPACWGSGVASVLMAHARGVSPASLELAVNQDNPRAGRFYARENFVVVGEEVNAMSGLKTWRLRWERSAPVNSAGDEKIPAAPPPASMPNRAAD